MLAASPAPVGTFANGRTSRNGVQSLGVLCATVYVFLAFSRFTEFLVQKIGVNLYIMAIVMFFSLIIVALNGRMSAFLTNTTLRWYLAFYLCLIASYPLSIWRAATLELLLYMFRMGLICVVLVGTLETVEDCRKAMLAIPVGMIIVLFIGFTAMPTADEATADMRFRLAYGSLSNPNEFANHMMIGLPLCAVVLLKRARLSLAHLFFGALFIGTVPLLMKTGSRGGLTIAAGLATVIFFGSSFTGKLKLMLAGAVLAIIAISVTPSGALQRYATIFSDTRSSGSEAVQSKAARLELLAASLRITAHHPIVGVGLSNFITAYNRELVDSGQHVHWEVAHNGYTQISSEAGIPALICYVAVIALIARGLLRVRKATKGIPQFDVAHRLSSLLFLALFAYALSNVFTSNTHEFYLPLLAGFSVALIMAADRELEIFRKARVKDMPAPSPAAQPRTTRPAVLAGRRLQVQQ